MGVATFRRMIARREGAHLPAPTEVKDEKHICPVCGFVAKTRLTLGAHMRVHKDKK